MKIKKSYLFWFVSFAAILIVLLYQNSFVEHHEVKGAFENPLKEDETIFISIKDHNFSFRKKGFDPLTDSLKFWDYNEKNGEIFLKEQSLLPSEFTPVVFVYDRGNDNFEKQENVLPISTFPYFIHQNSFEIEIIDISKEGEMFFRSQDKELSLKAGQTYKTVFLDGLKIRSITIENFGIKKLDQFRLFPEIEEQMKQDEERRKKEEKLLEETSKK